MDWTPRAFRTAFLVGIAPAALYSASVDFTFTSPLMGGAAGSQVLYYGDILNLGPSPVYLTSENVSVNGFTVDTSPFTSATGPASPIGGNGDSLISTLFTVDVPSAISNPYGDFVGSFNLYGGDTVGATDLLATANFLLEVVPALPSSVIRVDNSPQYGNPGDTVLFLGTITNGGASPLFLNGLQITPPAPLSADPTPFFLSSPLSLNPRTYTFGLPLFNAFIDANAGPGIVFSTVTLAGGVDGSVNDPLGAADFTVVVTPEPSTTLLGAMALLFMVGKAGMRRRV